VRVLVPLPHPQALAVSSLSPNSLTASASAASRRGVSMVPRLCARCAGSSAPALGPAGALGDFISLEIAAPHSTPDVRTAMPRWSKGWRGSSLPCGEAPSAGGRLESSSAVRAATHQNIRALDSRTRDRRRQLCKRHPQRPHIPLRTTHPRRDRRLSP
jgi:hypothetical protein